MALQDLSVKPTGLLIICKKLHATASARRPTTTKVSFCHDSYAGRVA